MSYSHFTTHERCYIVSFKELGWSLSKISKHIGKHKSSISRELKRNSIDGKYTVPNPMQKNYMKIEDLVVVQKVKVIIKS